MPEHASRTYKRDQVERAIARVTGRLANNDPTPEVTLKVDLKRLIDTDRDRERIAGARRYAFMDRPPGPGTDAAYSVHDAFALLIGERLMQGGFPQGTAVVLLRHQRRELDLALDRVLAADFAEWRPGCDPGERETRISHGTLVEDHSRKIYFVTPGDAGSVPTSRRLPTGELVSAHICQGINAQAQAAAHFADMRLPVITIELVNMALQLAHWLDRIPVRKRGRS